MVRRLSWEEHHILLALATSFRSPDPNTKVGACISTPDNRIISLGYNGPPHKFDSHRIPWDRDNEDPLKTKYPYVVHAEMNAILNAKRDLKNCVLSTTLYPCSECMKFIIQAGISDIYYFSDKYDKYPDNIVAKELAKKAKIHTEKVQFNCRRFDDLFIAFA